MKSIEYTITAADGIHARPAGFLVKKTAAYSSDVQIVFGEKRANARKLFAVMKLGVKHGDTITVTAEGSDEDEAIRAVSDFLASHF